jgi:hypothetical protein
MEEQNKEQKEDRKTVDDVIKENEIKPEKMTFARGKKKDIIDEITGLIKGTLNKKPIKTFPTTPEEEVRAEEMDRMAERLRIEMDKFESMKSRFWTGIEERLNIYGRHLQYNEKTKEIELFD